MVFFLKQIALQLTTFCTNSNRKNSPSTFFVCIIRRCCCHFHSCLVANFDITCVYSLQVCLHFTCPLTELQRIQNKGTDVKTKERESRKKYGYHSPRHT